MLTPIPFEAPSTSTGPFLYQCRAAAYLLHEVRSIPLGAHDAASPRLALRWLQERTRHITDQLDAPHARPGLYWLSDEAEHERALAYLTAGTGYQLTLHDESARYVPAVHPTGATL
ncbi:hypothetical protein [Streptomyces roseolilacinus]|uniref:Uncharacterized protein n=1 Tax=Streptomyces roseolilacinus TaxID=66904 RepID=A0A918AVF8_9ACTN|nr:hypothetical protein [Streptomyces roseolilacinus]GGP89602.1 hypothetical protein GCM10010249_04320 [Streptomyces roseolilacinus]